MITKIAVRQYGAGQDFLSVNLEIGHELSMKDYAEITTAIATLERFMNTTKEGKK